jgi:Fe-S cluster assembly iron-binding protein IscA
MALDEPRDTDDIYEIQGIQYIVDKEFMKAANPIKVDFKEIGFSISSSIDLGAACGDCGTKGSCCS